MRKTEVIAISVDPALKRQMLKLARVEHRTLSELIRECFRRYYGKMVLQELVVKGKKKAKELGIKESDIEDIIAEFRK